MGDLMVKGSFKGRGKERIGKAGRLRLRFILLLIITAVIGYYLAAKADFAIKDSFWSAISDDGFKAFLNSVFKCSIFEFMTVFVIGIGALTFFCDIVSYLSL